MSADQIVGKSGVDPAWRFVREDGAPMPFDEYPVNRVIADGRQLRNYVVGVVHGNGEEPSWTMVNAYPDLDPNGELRHVVVAFIDISEQKRSAEALASSAREIEDLYDNAPCGYHSLDAMGVFIKVNQTELRWLGYELDEILGKCFTDIITPASQKIFHENFHRFKQTGSVRELEFELIRKDGNILLVLLNATAIYDEEGRYLTSRWTLFDITSRKQAERRVAELLELNSRIIEESPLGIAAYKASGPCVFDNAVRARFVANDLAQLRTQDFRRIESWRKSELLPAALRVLVTGEPWHQEVYVETSFRR
jgi:PAS domain S-box-containing protein